MKKPKKTKAKKREFTVEEKCDLLLRGHNKLQSELDSLRAVVTALGMLVVSKE